MIQAKNKARFAMEGFRVRRSNPDKTMAQAGRVLGFSGTADISRAISATKKATLGIKLGNAAWENKELTFDTASIEGFTESLASLDMTEYVSNPSGAGSTYVTQLSAMEDAASTDFDENGINEALEGLTPVSKTGLNYTFNLVDVLEVLAFNTTNAAFKSELATMIAGAATIFKQTTVDVTAAMIPQSIDPEALTVPQAAALISAAGFSDQLAVGVDSNTQRLKLSTVMGDLQVKGKIAGAMDFGQGIKYGGFGTYWKTYIEDEAISCSFPNDMKDKEEIDLEGSKGTITRMVIPAKRLGVSPAIIMKFKDDELSQIIQGGTWEPPTATEPGIYDPPSSDAGGSPVITLDVFAPLYADGSSLMDQVIGMDRHLLYGCSGTEGDVPMEAKSWAQYAYNITATEYTDENGVKHPADRRMEYDLSQWANLDVAGVGAA